MGNRTSAYVPTPQGVTLDLPKSGYAVEGRWPEA